MAGLSKVELFASLPSATVLEPNSSAVYSCILELRESVGKHKIQSAPRQLLAFAVPLGSMLLGLSSNVHRVRWTHVLFCRRSPRSQVRGAVGSAVAVLPSI
jgi:hypothetical protein